MVPATVAGPQTRTAGRGVGAYFVAIFGAFIALNLIAWPILFSLNLWILKDRGSFLNLDYLLERHLRLGVDTFYCYGLLPVAIQHWLFALFGRGYWPLIGCAMVTAALIALFCALLLRELPREWIWLVAMIALSQMMNIVNPNLPYELVQLSLLYAVLFVLRGRAEIALPIAAAGCWAVPSLTLIMTALVAVVIVVIWMTTEPRSLSGLAKKLAPGVVVYALLGAALALEFGWASVAATATPLAGMRFYRDIHYGTSNAILDFLYPAAHHGFSWLAYALLTPALWWMVSTICLAVFGARAVLAIIVRRRLDPMNTAIVLCAAIHIALIAFAYGAAHQHVLFDPVLITGVLLGLSQMQQRRLRTMLLVAFIVLGVLGQAAFFRTVSESWKQVRSPQLTANLYADAGWMNEWKQILDLSQRKNLLLLSYSTGAHHYFPTVHSPDLWVLQVGQLMPSDKARVLAQMDAARVVVLDVTSPIDVVEKDADLQSHLHQLCLIRASASFQVWERPAAGAQCAALAP